MASVPCAVSSEIGSETIKALSQAASALAKFLPSGLVTLEWLIHRTLRSLRASSRSLPELHLTNYSESTKL